jgi:hypothetical protein
MSDFYGRVRSLLDEKLGRCAKCMRAARNGALLAWTCVGAIRFLYPNPVLLRLTTLVAASFTLLLLAHGVAVVARSQIRLKSLKRARIALDVPEPCEAARREFFGMMIKGGSAAALVSVVGFAKIMGAVGGPCRAADCNCYFTADCKGTTRGTKCNRHLEGGCTERNKPDETINGVLICGKPVGQPKCDGICQTEKAHGASWKNISPALVAKAADLYFSAYQKAAATGGGPPNSTLLKAALAVPLPESWHIELQNEVHNALTVILGWDFMPSLDLTQCFGQVPSLGTAPASLLDAARRGIVEGILQDDPKAVVQPIQEFWSQGDDQYKPMHLGVCYPHGHPEVTHPGTCQIQELEAIVEVINAGR